MRTEEIKVRFQPSGRTVYVLPGTKIVEAAGRAGIILQTPCGGQGTCGKCRVKIVRGTCSSGKVGPKSLPKKLWSQGYRLACQTAIEGAQPAAEGEVVIEIPAESMFETSQKILVGDSGAKGRFNPVIRKKHFKLAKPSSADPRSDTARLSDAVGNSVPVPPDLLRLLPGFLRAHDWQGTAVLAERRLIALESGDTARAAYGVAFDIGTTTVVGTLFNLVDGRELGVASRMNRQIAFGDDVLSRIRRVREDAGALTELQQAILETVNDIIAATAREAGVATGNVYEITIAGNTTMQQILCGFDPSALGEVPFVHLFDQAQTIPAARLGLRASASAEVFVFPQIGGFVGGDTVAGMLAARLDQWKKPVMLVDIGTNGEIVLAHDGRMQATSTAAGPAFEGARITQGMRATTGAVEKVLIRGGDVLLNVIGDAKPAGICGTALIDAVAELLRLRLLDPTGRVLPADAAPPDTPAGLRRRLVARDHETHFLLAAADETATGEDLYLWQRDIRELQLAAGAIRAGIGILLRRVGLQPDDLEAILLAGAFGNFIRRNNARRIGLLPPIPCERIRFIGNAASLGAKMVLLADEERDYAEQLRRKTEHVDLSLDAGFQEEFVSAMMFPEDEGDGCG
jgi:uncharacterized 2Fe-2S/4Fe-4S cluster protein (DUF4445 family)